jgi:hypothetical protein
MSPGKEAVAGATSVAQQSRPTLDAVIAELEARRERVLSAHAAGRYPRVRPIASDLSECDRYALLTIVGWAWKPAFGTEAAARMEQGRQTEEEVLRQLSHEGWKVVEQQAPFEIKGRGALAGRVILSGRIDGKLLVDGQKIPLEIKDVGYGLYERLRTEADLERSIWTRRWRRQLQAYMIGHGYEQALLLLHHRGLRRFVPLRLDYTEAEAILAQCERVLALLGTEPYRSLRPEEADARLTSDGLAFVQDRELCESCPFYQRACFPPTEYTPDGDVEIRPDLAFEVRRHEELREAHAEYERLDRKLAEQVYGKKVLAGEWLCTGEWRMVQTKPRPGGEERRWYRKLIRVGESPGAREGSGS